MWLNEQELIDSFSSDRLLDLWFNLRTDVNANITGCRGCDIIEPAIYVVESR